VFDASVQLALDACLCDMLLHIERDFLNVFLPLGFALRDLLYEVVIDVRLEIF
jgi:hypothetical protein